MAPVADLLDFIPRSVPQILINRDPVRHAVFDVCLLGEADVVIRELCRRLGSGWELDKLKEGSGTLTGSTAYPKGKIEDLEKVAEDAAERIGKSHVWLFKGANREHEWLAQWEPDSSIDINSQYDTDDEKDLQDGK